MGIQQSSPNFAENVENLHSSKDQEAKLSTIDYENSNSLQKGHYFMKKPTLFTNDISSKERRHLRDEISSSYNVTSFLLS